MLKVGALAKRAGLTVRALHHYDAIGLLSPSARSDAGYRLYNRADIARLHQVQALRRFGMALSTSDLFSQGPDQAFPPSSTSRSPRCRARSSRPASCAPSSPSCKAS